MVGADRVGVGQDCGSRVAAEWFGAPMLGSPTSTQEMQECGRRPKCTRVCGSRSPGGAFSMRYAVRDGSSCVRQALVQLETTRSCVELPRSQLSGPCSCAKEKQVHLRPSRRRTKILVRSSCPPRAAFFRAIAPLSASSCDARFSRSSSPQSGLFRHKLAIFSTNSAISRPVLHVPNWHEQEGCRGSEKCLGHRLDGRNIPDL